MGERDFARFELKMSFERMFCSERAGGAGFRLVNPAERWRENPARALARAGFSQHLECGIHRSQWIQPRGVFRFNPTPGSLMSKNYAIIIQFVLPLTTFYRSRAQKKCLQTEVPGDEFVTSWRFHNRTWQPQRHNRLPETSGTLWIHPGALTNQRCSIATGVGLYIAQHQAGRDGGHHHDDVIKWKHFPRNWPFVRGIHRSRWTPTQRPVTRCFDVFFDLRLNKRLSKQPWGWWFETPSWSLWRQCNDDLHYILHRVSLCIWVIYTVVWSRSKTKLIQCWF